MLGGPAAVARATTGGTPKHLLRSSYLPLAGQRFRVGGKVLQLGVVDDLAGAADEQRLRGHAEAFALTFYGPPGALGATVQTVSHPALGTFSLYVTPVGDVEGQVQRYEVVVDRSVGVPKRPPAPAKDRPDPDGRPGSEAAAAEALAEFERELVVEGRQRAGRIARRRRIKRRRLKRRRAKKATLARRRTATQARKAAQARLRHRRP